MFWISWILTFLAIYGTWLNANAKKEGFYWWIASNTGFAILNYLLGQFALSFLFTIYLLLAIKGIKTWGKNG